MATDSTTTDELDLHGPDGEPWCSFRRGTWCRNGRACLNPRHRGPSALRVSAWHLLVALGRGVWR